MISDKLNYFIFSYIFLIIAIFFAFYNLLEVCGLLTGLSIYFRQKADYSCFSAIDLIKNMPKWKWFSIIYLFSLMIIININSDYLYKTNPVFSTFIFLFPFIIPYLLNEYKIYKKLKAGFNKN